MHIIMSSAKYVRFKFTIAPPSSNIGDIVASGAGIVNLRAGGIRYGKVKAAGRAGCSIKNLLCIINTLEMSGCARTTAVWLTTYTYL